MGDESLPDWESEWRGSPPGPLAQRPASHPGREDRTAKLFLSFSFSLSLSVVRSPCGVSDVL